MLEENNIANYYKLFNEIYQTGAVLVVDKLMSLFFSGSKEALFCYRELEALILMFIAVSGTGKLITKNLLKFPEHLEYVAKILE